MEEEINYDVMRYELDEQGYILSVYFGCSSGMCTGYTGNVPEGYETLEEWYEDNFTIIRAWKIVDGNLAYDPNKNLKLETQYEKETEDNKYVCHKEISNFTNIIKSDSSDVYKRSTTDLSNILEVTDSNKYVSEYIKLIANENITGSVTIKFNNGNLLTNDATSKTESGISFVVNTDKSISIKGTATADIEFNIGGTSLNTKPIFTFKKGVTYFVQGALDYIFKFYYYDGTDRTLVYAGGFETITFLEDQKVTNIVLELVSGSICNDVIKPMISIGSTESEYITYQGNESTIYLDDNLFNIGEKILVENGSIELLGNYLYPSSNSEGVEGLKPSTTLTPSTTLKPNKEVKEQTTLYPSDTLYAGFLKYVVLDDISMPYTYLDKTYMYAYEDADLIVTYPNTEKDLDLCGYETPNKGFGVDEEGNMYCNNANVSGRIISTDGTIGGWTIDNNGINNGTLFINSNGFSTVYTVADCFILQMMLLGVIAKPETESKQFKHYDINNDGVLNALDLGYLQKMLDME